MEILVEKEDGTKDNAYKSINFTRHMLPLSRIDYDYVYRKLKYKDTYHFVDEGGTVNFLIKIISGKQIESVMKGAKSIYVFRDMNGPGIELSVGGLDKSYVFLFDLSDNRHRDNLKKLMSRREVFMHFIIYDEKQCIKCFSALLNIDSRIFERLNYMISLTTEGCYPRLELNEHEKEDANFIVVKSNTAVLEELLNIVDSLQKWGSKDCFTVYVSEQSGYKIFFAGQAINLNYIKNEILKKFQIFGEGIEPPSGKPFFKYDRGMLYFYKSNLEI